MKFFKWKMFLLTAFVCLLPVVFGVLMWDKLPDSMAIHFDINGVADNFASKGFVVFGIPLLMMLFQAISCFAIDYKGDGNKSEITAKWILPCVTVVLYALTICYSLGFDVDMRVACAIVVGVILIVTGALIQKLDRINNHKIDAETAKKNNKFSGIGAVISGILFIISAFLPPLFTLISVLFVILYSVTTIVYTIMKGK